MRPSLASLPLALLVACGAAHVHSAPNTPDDAPDPAESTTRLSVESQPTSIEVFAEFLANARDAVVASVTDSEAVAPRWLGPSSIQDLRGTRDEDRQRITSAYEPVFALVEGNLIAAERDNPQRIKFTLLMGMDGRVWFGKLRAMGMEVSIGTNTPIEMEEAAEYQRGIRQQLAEQAPELQELANYMSVQLESEACSLPMLTAEQMREFPAPLRAHFGLTDSGEMRAGTAIPPIDPVCELVRTMNTTWEMTTPEDFVVLGLLDGSVVELVSDMRLEDGDFFLKRIRVRVRE